MVTQTKEKPIIKDFHSNAILATNCVETPEGYKGIIELKGFSLKFSIKNVIASLAEGEIKISIEPQEGMATRPFSYHLKARSDSNKEILARQLKSAFSEYTAAWPLVVNDLVSSFIEALLNHKQAFLLSQIVGEPKDWLFEPFVMEHSINVLFGMGSAGKTQLALYFSILYGQGKNIWGKVGKQGNSLLVDFENDQLEWRDKMHSMMANNPMELDQIDKTFHYWQSEQSPLYDQVEKIKTYIRENNISLVIVDSASMASGDSTSDEASALRLMAALKLLDTTIILIAHQRKNEGEDTPIGSIQYFNQARNMWHIEGKPDDTDDRILHIGCNHKKNNSGRKWKKPIGIKVFFGEGFVDIHTEDAITNFQKNFTIKDQILKSLESGGKTHIALGEELDKKPGHIAKELSELSKKGKVSNFTGVWTLTYK